LHVPNGQRFGADFRSLSSDSTETPQKKLRDKSRTSNATESHLLPDSYFT